MVFSNVNFTNLYFLPAENPYNFLCSSKFALNIDADIY